MTKCRACDLNGHNFLHRKLEVVRTVAAIQRHGPMNPDIFATTSLTEGGIRSLIRLNGSLPEAYRFTAWKFLLRLPGNSSCFLELLRRGPHPTALDSLSTRYPLRDRRLYRKTAVLLSALAYWSPIWAEAEFVPGWLFPFVVVFQQVRKQTHSSRTHLRCVKVLDGPVKKLVLSRY